MKTPKQWHIYIVDMEPRVGTKPGKQRPCLSIQPNEFGIHGLESTVVLPVTTKLIDHAFPLRVKIPKETEDYMKTVTLSLIKCLRGIIDSFKMKLGNYQIISLMKQNWL